MNKKQTTDVICGAAGGIGAVGLVAPRMLGKLLGIPVDSGEMVLAMRLVASRNVVLALVPRLVDISDDYEPMLRLAAGLNAVDSVVSLAAGLTGKANKRGAFTLAALTAGLAAVAAMPLITSEK